MAFSLFPDHDVDDPLPATGIGLLVSTARPLANLNQATVINYETAFYSLTVSHNIICTLFIAGRIWHQQRVMSVLGSSGMWTYNAIIAVIVESAALYSLCGIIYIPLVVRMLPLQFPITAVIGSLTVRPFLTMTYCVTSDSR